MRTIDDYLDAALKAQKLATDSALADKLGITRASLSAFRKGRTFPSEKNMIEIARLAGMDEQIALIERSFWGSDGETKNAYEKVLKRIVSFIPATLFGLAAMHPDTAQAAVIIQKTAASLPHNLLPEVCQIMSGYCILWEIQCIFSAP